MASTEGEYRYQRYLAKSINAERAALGWTISELADRSGVDYQTLLRKLNLKRTLLLGEIVAIAQAMGTTVARLAADAEARMARESEPDLHPEDEAILNSAKELTESQRKEARRTLTGEADTIRQTSVNEPPTRELPSQVEHRRAR